MYIGVWAKLKRCNKPINTNLIYIYKYDWV